MELCYTSIFIRSGTDSLCINSIKSISVSIKNIPCQKSDGDLVGLSSYEEAGPVGHVAARVSVAGYFSSETAQDSLKFSMVPCKQTSAPTSPNNFINFKESDSNGNDIRKVNNFGDIYIYISIHSNIILHEHQVPKVIIVTKLLSLIAEVTKIYPVLVSACSQTKQM